MSKRTKFIPVTSKVIEKMFNKDASRDGKAPNHIPKTAPQKSDAEEGNPRRTTNSRRRSSFTSPSYRRPNRYWNGNQKPPVDTKKQWNSEKAQGSYAYKLPEQHLSPHIINPEARQPEKQQINKREPDWKVRNGELYSSQLYKHSSRPSSKTESTKGRDNSFGEKSSQGSADGSHSSGFKTDVETQTEKAQRYKVKDNMCQTDLFISCAGTQTDIDREEYKMEPASPPVTEMIAVMVGGSWEYNFTGAFFNFDDLESAEIWKLQKMLVQTTTQVCKDAEARRSASSA